MYVAKNIRKAVKEVLEAITKIRGWPWILCGVLCGVLLVLMSLCPVTCLIVLIIREIKSGWRYLSTKIPAEIEARVEKKKEEHYVRTGI